MDDLKKEIITCDVVQDLIPLVNDKVASADSECLVNEHIAHCEECRAMFELNDMSNEANANHPPDDKKILSYILGRYMVFICLIMMLGAMAGVLFTNTDFVFQNWLIMPIVGVLSYCCFKVKGSAVAVVVFMMTALQGFIQNEPGLAWYGIIYGVLILLGIIIAALLDFAFKKE